MPRKNKKTKRIEDKVIASKFAKAYVKNGGNATQAVLETKPISYDSARATGTRLLKREDVQREIQQALEDVEIDYKYILNTRKEVVSKGLDQLRGKRKEGESFVSPSDISKHLQGIEGVMDKLGNQGVSNRSSSSSAQHLHLHLEEKTPKEILTKRHELGNWFNGILDQD